MNDVIYFSTDSVLHKFVSKGRKDFGKGQVPSKPCKHKSKHMAYSTFSYTYLHIYNFSLLQGGSLAQIHWHPCR